MATAFVELEPQPHDDLTPEFFWQKWGEKSGFTPDQFDHLWKESALWYTDWPYHNFSHAKETLWETMHLADFCERFDYQVNRKALIAGTLFHDAGYHMDHESFGYESKEEYSAQLLGRHAHDYGMYEDDIVIAMNAIRATRLGAPAPGLHDKIIVRADIANIGGDFDREFAPKTELFRLDSQST
jgi:hypothetical protein